MRVGISLPVEDWRRCGPAAAAAEAAGADLVTTNENKHEPFTPLAMAGLATERIELATNVAIAFPRSPMIVASVSWELARHTGGRFVLGLGTQVRAHNERRFSVPWVAPAARMGEYVQALRAIWRCWETGGPLDYAGEHYRFSLMNEGFSPGPNHLPPRHLRQLLAQRLQPVWLQHGAVGGRGGVPRDAPADVLGGLAHALGIGAGRDKPAAADLEMLARQAGHGQALRDDGCDLLLQIGARGEDVQAHAVAEPSRGA